MRRKLIFLFAMGMVLSTGACAETAEEDTESTEVSTTITSAEAGETYTGTVTEISLEHLVLSTDDGSVTILYTEDTEFSGFSDMGGMAMGAGQMGGGEAPSDMGEMPGEPGGGMDASGQDSFQDITDSESAADSVDEESSAEVEGLSAEVEESSAEAEESSAEMEGSSEDMAEPPTDAGEIPAGQDGEDGSVQEFEDMGQQASSVEDVSLNDEVTVVVGDDGTAESVTLNTETEADGEMGGESSAVEDYDAATEYTSDTEVSGEELSSTGTDENAVLVATEGITVSLDDVTISRLSDDSTGGDNSSFYGVGASALVTDGILSISNSTITSDASGGAGVFAYGNGIAYVSDTTITTEQDTSGGIHVAGGGTLYAWDLIVETQGESAAAIRSDRGSGVMVVDGGSYTSNGEGSPAVYSTADITINNATLTANGSEAICIEGLNTIRLFNCDLSGNMSDLGQNDCTWNVILYQSMSGDSEVGNSTFEMVGGSLTAENGGMFYTTNTESTFIISGVEITGAQDSEFLLKCTGNSNERGWGTVGENGADCHFTALDQVLEGDVIWDSISQLDFYLIQGSSLTGAVLQDETNAGDGGDGYANLYIDDDSTWVVTGNSTLTSLACAGTIVDADGNSVSVVGSDGTVYVNGSSEYTITVESYTEDVDLSGASSLDSWEDYQVDPIS